MDLSFVREKGVIQIRATINVPGHGATTYTAQVEVGDAFYAGFVHGAMSDQFGTELAAIRKEAYEAGWRDARSKKRAKEKWFAPWWKI